MCKRPGGFTLLELMITIAVAAVLAAVAIPNMQDFIRNNRLTGAANDLLRAMQVARAEAIKRQQFVAVCASANPEAADPTCSNGAFTGWIIFEDENNNWQRDADEEVVVRQPLLENVTVVNDRDSIMSYALSGFTNLTPGQNPVTSVVMCDARGNEARGANSTARALLIEGTGRSRVTRLHAEIDTALAATGACPP